jgi:hypothetical protein
MDDDNEIAPDIDFDTKVEIEVEQDEIEEEGKGEKGAKKKAKKKKKRKPPPVEPLGLSINDTATVTAESVWTVKQKLRDGTYRAKKAGRRTIVIFASVKAAWETLPEATFMAPKNRAATKRGAETAHP